MPTPRHRDLSVCQLLDGDTEGAQRFKGGETIGTRQESRDACVPFGDRPQEQCPMGNRLVARHVQCPAHGCDRSRAVAVAGRCVHAGRSRDPSRLISRSFCSGRPMEMRR